MAHQVINKRDNKALHPTAYSSARSSLRFRRRVSLVDKHEDRSARWNRADLSGHISSLWKQSDFLSGDNRVLLLIAFDKSPEPLRRELDELHNNLNWETKNVVYHTRFWPDQAGRGFGVRLVAWARSMEDQTIL